MAMRTLGEALESALASMLNAGEEGTAIPSVSRKEAGTEKAPASVGGNNEQRGRNHSVKSAMDATQPGKSPASCAEGTGRATQNPSALPPRRVARPLLSVIEGGGRRQEGATSAAYRTRAGGGYRGCEFLKLVSG